MKARVYRLLCPTTLDVRYIGITTKTLKLRLRGHIENVKEGRQNRRVTWIRSLLHKGLMPIIEEIEPLSDNWAELERLWIAHYRKEGCNLVNGTDGGEGLMNPTPKVRRVLAKHQKDKWKRGVLKPRSVTEAQKAHLRQLNIGKKATPETCSKLKRKIKLAWRRRRKAGTDKIGPQTPEMVEKRRQAFLATAARRRAENGGKMYPDRPLSASHKRAIERTMRELGKQGKVGRKKRKA